MHRIESDPSTESHDLGHPIARRRAGSLRSYSVAAIIACVAIVAGVAQLRPQGAWALDRMRAMFGLEAHRSAAFNGDTVVIYGPHIFSTPTGSSTASVETFTATPTAGRRYSVIMEKGSGSLTTANVLFNGLQIASASDFSSATTVSKVVNLLSSDTIQVTLAGAAGATLTVSVISDPDPNYAIYGTRRFVKQGGGATTENFERPAAATAPFFLYVVNGPDGTNRATSGSIKIDNVDYATPSDFSNNVAGFVKQVSLTAGRTASESLCKGAMEAPSTFGSRQPTRHVR